MLILALDTSSRSGSVALARDGILLGSREGSPEDTHGRRLPGDLLALLETHRVSLHDIDLFAVGLGPGSFTGLRVGLATIQGLALVQEAPVVGVSSFDALAHAGARALRAKGREGDLLGTWVDAQRGEVFAALYGTGDDGRAAAGAQGVVPIDPPIVDTPEHVLTRWAGRAGPSGRWLTGDGAARYAELIPHLPEAAAWRQLDVPGGLAAAIVEIAAARGAAGLVSAPHALRPLYVRRPDAELARER